MITYTGVLALFDGTPDIAGDILDEDTAISLPTGRVPVTLYHLADREDFHLGMAQLFYRNGRLLYRIELSEECTAPKKHLDQYYPCIGGYLGRKPGSNKIVGITVDSVILNLFGNTDLRITPLGKQA